MGKTLVSFCHHSLGLEDNKELHEDLTTPASYSGSNAFCIICVSSSKTVHIKTMTLPFQ